MTGANSPFVVAAERLDGIAEKVRARHFARTGAKAPPREPAPAVIHPQAAWLRQFASHAVKPGFPLENPPLLMGISPITGPADRGSMETAAPPVSPPAAPPGPIGLAIGKPVRKSWMRRLFQGR